MTCVTKAAFRGSLFAVRVALVAIFQPALIDHQRPVCQEETVTIPFIKKDHPAANNRYSSDIGSGRIRAGRLRPRRLRDSCHGCWVTSPASPIKLSSINHAVCSSDANESNGSVGSCYRIRRSRRIADLLRVPGAAFEPYLVKEIVNAPVNDMRLVLQDEACGMSGSERIL